MNLAVYPKIKVLFIVIACSRAKTKNEGENQSLNLLFVTNIPFL